MERWNIAQNIEKICHEGVLSELIKHYTSVYKIYFKLVDLPEDLNLNGKSIMEIGPAKISAISICQNYKQSYVIEPIIYDTGDYYTDKSNINFIREPAETCFFPNVDEVWLFNILQHVINPVKIINNCKKYSKIIRFFEPIDWEINDAHPHKFDINFYKTHFGLNNTHLYVGNSISNFHSSNCAYGVYKNVDVINSMLPDESSTLTQ